MEGARGGQVEGTGWERVEDVEGWVREPCGEGGVRPRRDEE